MRGCVTVADYTSRRLRQTLLIAQHVSDLSECSSSINEPVISRELLARMRARIYIGQHERARICVDCALVMLASHAHTIILGVQSIPRMRVLFG